MRQMVYVSTRVIPAADTELRVILNQSVHNNALDGITGVLLSHGLHFIQVLEGSGMSVEPCFQRILNDDRHHSINIVLNRFISDREFGCWNMLYRCRDDPVDLCHSHVNRLLSYACEDVRVHFKSFLAAAPDTNGKPASAAPKVSAIPPLKFDTGRIHWDEIRNGVMFEGSGPDGHIKYMITPSAMAELVNNGKGHLDEQQCMREFRRFERQIYGIAQRTRRPFEKNLPPIVIRRDDVRGE